jgi:hypothetical protein
MPDQDNAGGSPQNQETSDALKKHVESPEYSEAKPEEILKSKDKKEELHKIMEKNKEEIKKSEKTIEIAREQIEKKAPSSSSASSADKQDVKKHVDEVMAIEDASLQVQRVVELASSKDPFFAIKVAQQLDDNFVLDQVHDELIEDQVRNILIDKGLLKED